MSQISRPVQIVFAAVLLAAVLWFFALRPKPQSDTTASTPAPAPTAPGPNPSPTKPYNTKTPVVGGLLGAVNKAEGAVATSSANANALEQKSAAASASSPQPATSAPAAAGTPAAGTATQPSTQNHAATGAAAAAGTAHATTPTTPTTAAANNPAAKIATQLAAGKTVALLFWNPQSTDDQAVHDAIAAVAKQNHKLVADFATSDQVAEYGTVVDTSQVVETPTLLVMKGKTIQAITDLQDPSDLRQFIQDQVQGGPGEVLTQKVSVYAAGTTRAEYVTRVNKVCKKLQGDKITIPANATPLRVVQIFADAEYTFLRKLQSVPMPPADRGYLLSLIAHERLATQQFVQAFSARSGVTAHSLYLSGQTNDDFAVEGTKQYGLYNCVVHEDS
jgi:hypothetical protein